MSVLLFWQDSGPPAVTGTAAVQAIATASAQANLAFTATSAALAIAQTGASGSETFTGTVADSAVAQTGAAGSEAFTGTIASIAIATWGADGTVEALTASSGGGDNGTVWPRRPHHPDAGMEEEILALLVS